MISLSFYILWYDSSIVHMISQMCDITCEITMTQGSRCTFRSILTEFNCWSKWLKLPVDHDQCCLHQPEFQLRAQLRSKKTQITPNDSESVWGFNLIKFWPLLTESPGWNNFRIFRMVLIGFVWITRQQKCARRRIWLDCNASQIEKNSGHRVL